MYHQFQSRETRYGIPSADQILVNRFFTIGYSYYFRQAKWTLEIVDPDKKDMDTVERRNKFKSDYRIPKRFRADLSDYSGSGYDRGHLVASANHNDEHIQNSETFLLSNMSPQTPDLNRQKWRELETKVRELDNIEEILETYVITGPIFDFGASITMIGENDDNGVRIPVPSHFYKCILTEDINGKLKMWSFEIPNTNPTKPLKNYLTTTSYIEQRAGINLWSNLTGSEIEKEKNIIRSIW
jgi:endonuclease G